MILKQVRVGTASPEHSLHSLQPWVPSNSPKTYLCTTNVFDIQVELCFMNENFTPYLNGNQCKLIMFLGGLWVEKRSLV